MRFADAEDSRADSRQSAPPLRLGLLGGSFNPIHYGHLGIAREALTRLALTRVLFIPTGDPPHKRNGELAPAQDRYAMVRLAIAGMPAFDVTDIEIRRTGKSYSIDTVRELQDRYGPETELFFLIGLDAFRDFPSWRDPQALLSRCRFVVLSRPGQSFQSLTALPLLPALDGHALTELDTGTTARVNVDIPGARGLILLALPPYPISASDIRRRVQQGASLANLLPPPVESYILQHRLYREDRDRTRI